MSLYAAFLAILSCAALLLLPVWPYSRDWTLGPVTGVAFVAALVCAAA